MLGTLLLMLGAGCGGDGDDPLTILAASSLRSAFQELAPDNSRMSFGGSDELASQLREGAPVDVFAAAAPGLPAQLFEDGLIDEPQVFATNRLVLIIPRDNPAKITNLDDLDDPDVRLIIGAEGVPVGSYTREALEVIGKSSILDSVVSQEQSVKGVVAKVALGEADAGFVYATDVAPVADYVTVIELPAAAQVKAVYPISTVVGADQLASAEAFIDLLLSDKGRRVLQAHGFGVP